MNKSTTLKDLTHFRLRSITTMKFHTMLALLFTTALASSPPRYASPVEIDENYNVERSEALEEPILQSCATTWGGCENGYCWRRCDASGEWCWLAEGQGHGPWVTCSRDSDCAPSPFWDVACGICDEPVCGCSCNAH